MKQMYSDVVLVRWNRKEESTLGGRERTGSVKSERATAKLPAERYQLSIYSVRSVLMGF